MTQSCWAKNNPNQHQYQVVLTWSDGCCISIWCVCGNEWEYLDMKGGIEKVGHYLPFTAYPTSTGSTSHPTWHFFPARPEKYKPKGRDLIWLHIRSQKISLFLENWCSIKLIHHWIDPAPRICLVYQQSFLKVCLKIVNTQEGYLIYLFICFSRAHVLVYFCWMV